MKLGELASACYLYRTFTGYDDVLSELIEKVGKPADLSTEANAFATLRWLNGWGCRQFKKEDHASAAAELIKWFKTNRAAVPDLLIQDLGDENFKAIQQAFDALAACQASVRKLGSNKVPVKFGPVGAAKIFLAIGPDTYPPWDGPIFESFGFEGSGSGYVNLLKRIKEEIKELEAHCKELQIELDQVPELIGYKGRAIPKLIDQYYWVTITNGVTLPSKADLQEWLKWMQ